MSYGQGGYNNVPGYTQPPIQQPVAAAPPPPAPGGYGPGGYTQINNYGSAESRLAGQAAPPAPQLDTQNLPLVGYGNNNASYGQSIVQPPASAPAPAAPLPPANTGGVSPSQQPPTRTWIENQPILFFGTYLPDLTLETSGLTRAAHSQSKRCTTTQQVSTKSLTSNLEIS